MLNGDKSDDDGNNKSDDDVTDFYLQDRIYIRLTVVYIYKSKYKKVGVLPIWVGSLYNIHFLPKVV